MLAAVVYPTTGVLAARAATSGRTKVCVLLVAAVITLLVGVSRMVLGVHYPTDVLAGLIGGTVWVFFCWLTAKSLHVVRFLLALVLGGIPIGILLAWAGERAGQSSGLLLVLTLVPAGLWMLFLLLRARQGMASGRTRRDMR